MSDDAVPAPKPELEAPMAAWVKGGTTSLRHDQEVEKRYAEAEERRRAEAARHQFALANPDEARVHSMKLSDRSRDAKVVLAVKHAKDTTLTAWIECELIVRPDGELWLQLACPRCIFRHHRHLSDAQLLIRQTHRWFDLDERTKDQRKPGLTGLCRGDLWVNPDEPHGPPIVVAGTITVKDLIRCSNLGCDWAARIDDSVIYVQ